VIPSLDERRSQRARRKAAASASSGRNEGISLEGRGRERLLGMKGWRPSAILKARNRFGVFTRANSCRTSDRSACLSSVLGPRSHDPGIRGRQGSLLALIRLRGPQAGRK
jgi:hypothetical protein